MTFGYPTNAAKSARRTIALALLGVFAFAGLIYAAGGVKDFNIGASPSSVTVAPGSAATYSIQLSRMNGFVDPVSLTLTSLPPGVTAIWSTNPFPAVTTSGGNSTMLKLQTSNSAPEGTYEITVTGAGGTPRLSRQTSLTLHVQGTQPNFTLRGSPSTRSIAQDDDALYTITVNRSGGFSGPVALSAVDLPDRTTATFTPSTIPANATEATVKVHSAANAPEGAFTFKVRGTATSIPARHASLALNLEKTKPITIAGGLPGLLSPGVDASLDLALTNLHNFDVLLHDLSISVEEGTSAVGCSGSHNYKAHQMPAAVYAPGTTDGLWLPRNSTRTLSQLGVDQDDWPHVEMFNLNENQDACKNAKLVLQYSGTVIKK